MHSILAALNEPTHARIIDPVRCSRAPVIQYSRSRGHAHWIERSKIAKCVTQREWTFAPPPRPVKNEVPRTPESCELLTLGALNAESGAELAKRISARRGRRKAAERSEINAARGGRGEIEKWRWGPSNSDAATKTTRFIGLLINAHLHGAFRTPSLEAETRGCGTAALENIEAEDKWLEQVAWTLDAKKNVD